MSIAINRKHLFPRGKNNVSFALRLILFTLIFLAAGFFPPVNLLAAGPAGISPIQLQKIISDHPENVTLINCMSLLECMDSRIPGSLCMEGGWKNLSNVLETVKDRNRQLVFYCESESCHRSSSCLQMASKAGYHRAVILEGGFPAWKEAGFSVESVHRIPRTAHRSVRGKELHGWLQQKHPLTLLDVRDAESYRENHISAAINIPLEELHERYHEIPLDHPIVVIDNRGFRSFFTASYLHRKGFSAMRLLGGMQKWREFSDKELNTKKKRWWK